MACEEEKKRKKHKRKMLETTTPVLKDRPVAIAVISDEKRGIVCAECRQKVDLCVC